MGGGTWWEGEGGVAGVEMGGGCGGGGPRHIEGGGWSCLGANVWGGGWGGGARSPSLRTNL